MLALKVTQKDGAFYVTSYKAEDILRRVRFQSRYYTEDEEKPSKVRQGEEDVARFIASVERSDKSFQRTLKNRKVKDIADFYANCQSQPMIPSPVLLYSGETLKFEPTSKESIMGNLIEPVAPFLIIDGQHRLAGLKVFMDKNPQEAKNVEVPAIIYDGKQEDFAAEMFVIINSTQTKINRSHLVDLMEKVTYGTTPEKKWAAWIVTKLYEEQASPLRYKINRLGGRSRQEKWIHQSELYNEIYKLANPGKTEEGSLHRYFATEFGFDRRGRAPELFIDYLRAVKDVFRDVWNDPKYNITSTVLIKAYVRVLGDLLKDPKVRSAVRDGTAGEEFLKRLEGWKDYSHELRKDGFYDRFSAKGQLERVRKVHTELGRRLTN